MKCFRGALKIAKCWIVGHKLRAAVLAAVLLVLRPGLQEGSLLIHVARLWRLGCRAFRALCRTSLAVD